MSLLDTLMSQTEARKLSAAYGNRPPVRQQGLNQPGTDALANFGMMAPGLVSQIADYQSAQAALEQAELQKRQSELLFNQLEDQRRQEMQGGPLAPGQQQQQPPLATTPGGFMMDIPQGPLAPQQGDTRTGMMNRAMATNPDAMLAMRKQELAERKQSEVERAAGVDEAGIGGPWSLEDMRKEYQYDEYTPASVKQAEKARDPSQLTKKADKMKFSDKLAGSRFVTAQMAPFEEVANSTEQAFAMLEGTSGPEELGALIKFAKALDPGSVVREGEVTMQQQAAGIMAKWENILESLQRSGSALSDPHKRGIFDGLKKIAEINQTREGYHRDHYSKMMQNNDIGQDFMPPRVRWVIPPQYSPVTPQAAPGAATPTAAPSLWSPLPPPTRTVTDPVQRSYLQNRGVNPDDPVAVKRYEKQMGMGG